MNLMYYKSKIVSWPAEMNHTRVLQRTSFLVRDAIYRRLQSKLNNNNIYTLRSTVARSVRDRVWVQG